MASANLSYDDTRNLEVVDRIGPSLIADVELGPTGWKGGLQQRANIAYREED
jgi:hypothetical protein